MRLTIRLPEHFTKTEARLKYRDAKEKSVRRLTRIAEEVGNSLRNERVVPWHANPLWGWSPKYGKKTRLGDSFIFRLRQDERLIIKPDPEYPEHLKIRHQHRSFETRGWETIEYSKLNHNNISTDDLRELLYDYADSAKEHHSDHVIRNCARQTKRIVYTFAAAAALTYGAYSLAQEDNEPFLEPDLSDYSASSYTSPEHF